MIDSGFDDMFKRWQADKPVEFGDSPSPLFPQRSAREIARDNAVLDLLDSAPDGFKTLRSPDSVTDEEFLLMLIAKKLDEISSKLDKLIEQ